MEAIVFITLRIFCAKHAVLKIGEYSRYSPAKTQGNIRSRDAFGPIARERKYLADYKYNYQCQWGIISYR